MAEEEKEAPVLLPNGEPLDRFVPYLMNRIAATANADLSRRLRKRGLSFQNWRVLLILSQRGRRTIGQLVRETVIPQSTLSRVLMRMERDGLIARHPVADDNRSYEMSLTERGGELFAAAFQDADAAYRAMIAPLTPEQVATLRPLLQQMRGGRQRDLRSSRTRR